MNVVITTPGSVNLPPDYERRLANGAIIIFGESMLHTLEELNAGGHGEGQTIVASEAAENLPLPRTLMIGAVLVFAHAVPGLRGRGPTKAEMERWRDKLFDRLTWVEGSEPQPEVGMYGDQQTPEITLQLVWSGKDASWQGVNSAQVKRIAVALERRYRLALKPAPADGELPGEDWQLFEHPDGLFKLAHPRLWPEVPRVSDGASLSCAAKDGSALLEVICAHSPVVRGPWDRQIVDVIADGIAEIPAEYRDGRVLHRREVARGSRGKCVRMAVSFTEKGLPVSTDYFIAGSAYDALYVALKSPTSALASNQPYFERVLATLQTPWLAESGAPAVLGRHD